MTGHATIDMTKRQAHLRPDTRHHGACAGKARSGIPVYNVAMSLMTKMHPDQRFMLLEV